MRVIRNSSIGISDLINPSLQISSKAADGVE